MPTSNFSELPVLLPPSSRNRHATPVDAVHFSARHRRRSTTARRAPTVHPSLVPPAKPDLDGSWLLLTQDLDRPVTRSGWLRNDPLAQPPVELHRIGRHLAAAPTMDSAPSRRPGSASFLSAPSSFTSTDQCQLLSASPLPLRRVRWHEIQGARTPGPGARPSKHPGVTTTPRRPQAMNRWKDPAMRGGELLGRGDRLLAPRRMPVRTTISEPPDFLTVEEAALGAAYRPDGRVPRRPAGGSDTNGEEGLPVVSFGRVLRVPLAALERMTGGSITVSPQLTPEAPKAQPQAPNATARPHRRAARRHRPADPPPHLTPMRNRPSRRLLRTKPTHLHLWCGPERE